MSDLPTLAPTPLSVYAERRARVAQAIGPNGIAIVPTAPERQRNRDSDFLYRHDSYFYYLTGFTEANAWLVITGDGHSTLWCNPKDLEREIWDGYRLGPDAAPAGLGGDRAGHPAAQAAGKPRRGALPLRHPQRPGNPGRRLAGPGARPGALRRPVPGHAARPVRRARRDAPDQGRARTGHHAPGRPDQRPRPCARHAAQRQPPARRPGGARIPPGRRTAARVPPPWLAVPGLQLHRGRRGQCLRAALPRRYRAGA